MSSEIRNQYNPDYVSPPGETLADVLEEKGMSQAELVERTGRPKKTISEIINGKAMITPDTALQLERVLGIPAHFWNQREQNYQDYLARLREQDRLKGQLEWLDCFPVREMVKLGWIESCQDDVQQVRTLLNFFGVASPKDWETYWDSRSLSYRKSAFDTNKAAITAWLRKGELEAQQIETAPYDAVQFKQALEKIRTLTVETPQIFMPALRLFCAAAGVAVVFVPEIPRKTRVCGVMRWLSPTKALIQLSLRYKSDDHFWFTFFHEARHVLQERKREMFLEGITDYDPNSLNEQDADQFSASFLIPEAALKRFKATYLRLPKSAIVQFANEIGVAPGIVVGRLQHDNALDHSHCNDLKQKLKWV